MEQAERDRIAPVHRQDFQKRMDVFPVFRPPSGRSCCLVCTGLNASTIVKVEIDDMDLRVVSSRCRPAAGPHSGSSPRWMSIRFSPYRSCTVRRLLAASRVVDRHGAADRLAAKARAPRTGAGSAWSRRKCRPPRRCSARGSPESPGRFPAYCSNGTSWNFTFGQSRLQPRPQVHEHLRRRHRRGCRCG